MNIHSLTNHQAFIRGRSFSFLPYQGLFEEKFMMKNFRSWMKNSWDFPQLNLIINFQFLIFTLEMKSEPFSSEFSSHFSRLKGLDFIDIPSTSA